jgi:hypothetical protein
MGPATGPPVVAADAANFPIRQERTTTHGFVVRPERPTAPHCGSLVGHIHGMVHAPAVADTAVVGRLQLGLALEQEAEAGPGRHRRCCEIHGCDLQAEHAGHGC